MEGDLQGGAGELPVLVRQVVDVRRELEHACHRNASRNRAILPSLVRVSGVAPDSFCLAVWVPALVVISHTSVCVLMGLGC